MQHSNGLILFQYMEFDIVSVSLGHLGSHLEICNSYFPNKWESSTFSRDFFPTSELKLPIVFSKDVVIQNSHTRFIY